MIHQLIKDLFASSVEHICSDISNYSIHPGIDFQRSRKISPQKLISFLVSQGSSSTRVEMLDFWGLDPSSLPTSSALNQQRQKLKSDALEAVFKLFNSSVTGLLPDTLRNGNIVFWLQTVLPAHISVLHLFPQMTIIVHPVTPSEESTVCI